ncbi:MAG: mycofactocin-coupled SDR family oxidoreductase [Streptosporangiaceae bacterium]
MGRVAGKVAFITGAGHGQGRSHAVRLAEEGADIIAVDLCEPVETVPYRMSAPADLEETVHLVEKLDRRIIATRTDVRDYDALKQALYEGVTQLGRLDIVAASAGIVSYGPAVELTERSWQDVIDVNLTGVWHTCKAAIPHLIEGGHGGAMILTSSVAGLKGWENQAHYVSSKHAVVGLMRTLARELAQHYIRVNTVHPTAVDTDMLLNDYTYKLFRPELDAPTLDDAKELFYELNALPTPWVKPVDISNALLFLASDEARYITGVTLPVDAGCLIK